MDSRKFKIYITNIIFLIKSASLENSFYVIAQYKFQISISRNDTQFSDPNVTNLKLIKAAFLESFFSPIFCIREEIPLINYSKDNFMYKNVPDML